MRTYLLLLFALAASAAAQTTSPQITVPRGDRLTLRFPCQYPDGSVVNISNWTLEASIRASLTGAAVTNYTETAGAGGTNGVLTWAWDVGLIPGRYLMGFRWTTADGVTFTPLPRAPFTVLPSLLSPTNGEAVAGAPPATRGEPREWSFTSQISPTAGTVQSLAVNVGLRGATGPQGEQGPAASTNGLVGIASLGLLAWSNAIPWALVEGEPTFLVPGDTNGYAAYASLGSLAFSNTVSWSSIDGEPTFLVPADTNGNWGYATTTHYVAGTIGPFSDAPASASLQSYNGGSGGTYWNSAYDHAIRVHAYRTNFAGTKYYAAAYAQSDTVNDGGGDSENYTLTWQWGAVAGAHGYLVLKSDTYSGYAYDYGVETTATSWEDDGTGFSALTASPTTALTSNLVTVPTIQTGVLHGAVLRGTTDVSQATLLGLPSGSEFPPTGAQIYCDPSFSGSAPYFTNLIEALNYVNTGLAGVRSISNSVSIHISGRHRVVADAAHSFTSSNYHYLTIVSDPGTVFWADIAPVGDTTSFISLSGSNVTINGGRWISYSASGQNERFLSLTGANPNVVNATFVSDGGNGNLNAALMLQNSFGAWVKDCQFLQGQSAGSGCRPLDVTSAAYATIQRCAIQMWRSGNIAINLNAATDIEFLNCSMVCSNTSTSQAFLRLHPANAVYEGCSFVNLGTTNIFGIAGDTDRTIWLIDCTFNTASWLGDPGLTTTGTWTVVPGYPGVRITTQE